MCIRDSARGAGALYQEGRWSLMAAPAPEHVRNIVLVGQDLSLIHIWIRDPASAGNSARAFTLEELEQVDFHYFYCIRGGFYGTQRH